VKAKPKRHPVRYATAMRLERAVYANAARLFLDACTLYQTGAFPSAYSLAILAFEEVGKVQMMDHVCFEAVLNDGSFRLASDRMEHLFSRDMFYSHRNKQAWGIYRDCTNGRLPAVERLIDDHNTLDRHKQDALYVGFSAGRMRLPTRFRATHAHRQLHYVIGAFEQIADLPFYGVFEDSTRTTKREAKRVYLALRKAFDALPSPRTRNA
jgi:AbiV family abortive infection protein